MQIRIGVLATAALLFAHATGLGQGTLYTFHGGNSEDRFGISVAGVGDLNSDGHEDLLVGAHQDDDGASNAGSARVFSGMNGTTLYIFNGTGAGDAFGRSVSCAGDVNNDGFPDLVIGAHLNDDAGTDSGRVRVFSGMTGAVLHTFRGDSTGDQLGRSVSAAGDVNNDGFDDLILGAYRDDDGGADAGSARVCSGADGSVLFTFHGGAAGDSFGFAVDGAGDINGDGHDDLIIGSFGDDPNGSMSGSAWLYSGSDYSQLGFFPGDAGGDWFGASVCGGRDVTGDAVPDLLIGAYGDDNTGSLSGSARVHSGSDGSIHATLNGASAGDLFGISVALIGDLDGDGCAELLIGAEKDDNNGSDSGSARLHSGFSGALLFSLDGDGAGDLSGFSVAAAGDVNQDGLPDLIVGAHGDDDGGAGAGSARVSSGGCGALSTYGVGCPGAAGLVPALSVTGCSVPSGEVSITLDRCLGSATAQLFFGLTPASLPMKGSCT